MIDSTLILAQGSDNGAAGVIFILICIGLCWAINKKPPTKTETIVGQKTTKYG